ncbi:MAG TPA: ferritin-like domain-containing protein [Gemmatimonadota bacterium]|nr:ferritin-like domain-containing protein [Gemmatimonadota bacterium]
MKLETLDDLFGHLLQDLYSAEKQITRALPKLAKAVEDTELAEALETHLDETKGQVDRLEKIFEELDKSPGRKKCVGMEGLLEEGSELIKEEPDPMVLDAGLISAAQKVEHYEIAAYGTAVEWARILGYTKAEKLLQQTLEEESAANEKLTMLAEEGVNEAAMEGVEVE